MKNSSILKSAAIASLILFFGLSGAHRAEAASQTYYINSDGTMATDCGVYCDQYNAYLASQNLNSSGNSSSSGGTGINNGQQAASGTGGSSNPYACVPANDGTTYVQCPYQVYTNFASTNAYYAASTTMSQPVQYPYQVYGYFQNPNPNPTPVRADGTYAPYPTPVYTYYGQDASAQLSKYQQTSTGAYSGLAQNPNAGFVLTSSH